MCRFSTAIRILFIAVITLVVFSIVGCGGGTSGKSASNSSKTVPVTLSFKVAPAASVKSMTGVSSTRAPISSIKTIYIKISGILMTDISDTFAFGGTATVNKTYQVPIGIDRTFYIEARGSSDKVLYKGQKIQNVIDGANSVTVDLYTTEEFAQISMTVDVPNVPQSIAPLYGACVGLYGADGNPNLNTQISEDRARDWLTKIKPCFSAVRYYSCRNGMDKACAIAKSLGYYVYAQAWIGSNPSVNRLELDAAIDVAKAGNCDVLIVGSEVLLRGDLIAGTPDTPEGFDTLIGCIKYASSRVDVPVTYNDIGSILTSNLDVVNLCEKVVLANLYPYWEGSSIEDAAQKFQDSYNSVRAAISTSLEVVVGETGWPTGGNAVGAAIPNPDNARRYLSSVTNWATAAGVKVLWFEAIDEAWKASSEGPQGACWGLFDTDCAMKSAFKWLLY